MTKAASFRTRSTPRQATRFIVYRTAQGYWIASTKDGRVTGAFPVLLETLRHLQSSVAQNRMRGPSASPARRS